MTISAKLSDFGGLEFVVSDPADEDGINGYSDSQESVGGKSAKFSDATIMKANTGKRIGITQVQFNTALALLNRSVNSETSITNSANMIDNSLSSYAVFTSAGTSEIIIDFGSIATAVTKYQWSSNNFGSVNIEVEKSDNSTGPWTSIDTDSSSSTTPILQDLGSHSFRYLRISYTSLGTALRVYEVWREPSNTPSVDVQLLSTAAQDSTTATKTLIGTTTINSPTMENQTPITSLHNSSLLLTADGEYVTLRVVSYSDSNFKVPVTLSDITTVKEI